MFEEIIVIADKGPLLKSCNEHLKFNNKKTNTPDLKMDHRS